MANRLVPTARDNCCVSDGSDWRWRLAHTVLATVPTALSRLSGCWLHLAHLVCTFFLRLSYVLCLDADAFVCNAEILYETSVLPVLRRTALTRVKPRVSSPANHSAPAPCTDTVAVAGGAAGSEGSGIVQAKET